MLQVEINAKSFDSARILEGVNFCVSNCEIVAVVGPSGAGKTTLLNLIAGLDSNFTGEVKLHDTYRGGGAVDDIAYIFQEPRLLPWCTVLENVLLASKEQPANPIRALQMLSKVGLGDCGTRYPAQLSVGMQRRVALARAFFIHPRVLLMDEPFVSLDNLTAANLRTEFLALWRGFNAAVVLVTHDLNEALSLADRILFFSKSPARITLEYKVPKPRAMCGELVETCRHQLLEQNPRLLSGLSNLTEN